MKDKGRGATQREIRGRLEQAFPGIPSSLHRPRSESEKEQGVYVKLFMVFPQKRGKGESKD